MSFLYRLPQAVVVTWNRSAILRATTQSSTLMTDVVTRMLTQLQVRIILKRSDSLARYTICFWGVYKKRDDRA